jgi:hypothetical protein
MKVLEIPEGKSAAEEEKWKKWIFIKIFLFFCWSLMQKWKINNVLFLGNCSDLISFQGYHANIHSDK